MLNAEIASNILRHIFKAPDYLTLEKDGTNLSSTSSVTNVTDRLQGKGGERYLALFTAMPTHEVDGDNNYVIHPGMEPWGPWNGTESTGTATEWNNHSSAKSVTGYLRNKMSNNNSGHGSSLTPTTTLSSKESSKATSGTVSVKFGNEPGNKGISGGDVISEPKISNGTDYDESYGRPLLFNPGSAFIYNSDMIFFPESIGAWGKIVGFGVFNDSGKNTDGTVKVMDEDYYTEHLLFWGTLTATEENSDGTVFIDGSEIAIFRNNDFQVTINHGEN